MSLARTALRVAAIAALNSHPVLDALCEGRIYDSRIGDFDHGEPVPVIKVTTEELAGDAVNEQNGGAPFLDACNLVLEIAMTQVLHEDGEDLLLRPPTDGEMEARIDLIEQCAEWMLTLGRPTPVARPTPAGQVLRKAVVRRVPRRTSDRFTDDESGEKLAIHLLTFRVELKGEDVDMRALPTGPFAVLPDPLRTVAESLPEGSSGLSTCKMLADLLALVPPATARLARAEIATPADPAERVPGTFPIDLTVDFPQD